MNIQKFLARLRDLNINLWVEGDRVRLNAPKGVLTPELRTELAQRKVEILAFLQTVDSPLEKNDIPPLQPVARDQPLPLSFAQQRLWIFDQMAPGSPVYNISTGLYFKTRLNLPVLEKSINEIVRRHETLRTTFAMVNDQPVQRIATFQPRPLPVIDLRHLSEAERENEARRLAAEEARQAFDLTQGPLFRATLLQLADEEQILLFNMHHIIVDGWSIGVLLRELDALYSAFSDGRPSPLPDLQVQYADFAVWQRQWLTDAVLQNQLDYWKKQLAGPLPVLELPTDHQRPKTQTFRGATHPFVLPPELANDLTTLSKQAGATLFMTLLAVFEILLYRYTGQKDLIVGTPVANRNQVEIEKLIGFFVNTLVLRTDLAGNLTFQELLARVREVSLEAFSHQDVPFEQLVETLHPQRDASRSPLFQVMFVFEKAIVSPLDVDNGTAKFDLTLFMWEEAERLTGLIEYNTDLFEAATIGRMAGHLQTLLAAVVSNPDRHIAELPLLTKREEQLLAGWNETSVAYPAAGRHCLHQLFEAQVKKTPEAVAVLYPSDDESETLADRCLTFQTLNQRANQLAHHLRALGVGPETLVGVYVDRSPEMVVALLGTLKAGGAYVPIDPTYPKERVAFMLADAQIPVLLTQHRLVASLPDHQPARIICLDTGWPGIALESHRNPTNRTSLDNLAYVIYTSGSTGNPKGAMISHRAIVNHMNWMNTTFPLTRTDRVIQKTPFSFDASVWEFYAPLLTGAQLVVAPPGVHQDGTQLVRLIVDYNITVLQLVPTQLRMILETNHFDACHSLKRVFCGGEMLPAELTAHFFSRSDAALYNLYGPTEAAIDSTFWACQRDSGEQTIPIGRPIDNMQTYILDANLQPVPVGIAGELHLGGAGLARGYFNRPDLTAEKFIPDPFGQVPAGRLYKTGDLARYRTDGSIEFLGRFDHQVKVRGFRIELGEIEAVLNQHPAVRDSVLVVWADTPGDERLVAYVTVTGLEAAGLQDELRQFLAKKLPKYMLPAAIIDLERLPLTPNGKIDRQALPAPDWTVQLTAGSGQMPQTPTEEMLVGIWARVLGLGQVSTEDNFFDLGGHSLLATQLISRIRETFRIELSLRSLFESPTVAELAKQIDLIRLAGQVSSAPPIVPVSRDQDLPLSFSQQRLWFLDQLEPGTHYNVPIAVRLEGKINIMALEQSLNDVVRRHEVLRTVFKSVDGEPVQVIQSFDPFNLPVIDLRPLPEAEREAEARTLVKREAQHHFDLAKGPLLRVILLQLGQDDYIYILNMHHIVSDIWSMGLFVWEVTTLYRAYSTKQAADLPELAIQYADFAVWQRRWLQGQILEEQLAYWKKQLSGSLTVLELPADRPRPDKQTFRGAAQDFTLSIPLTKALKTLSRQTESTLFMTLLAAFKVLLHRYTGQTDILVGSPIANRPQSELENLIGFFLNTLVLRTDLSGNPPFRELLHRVRDVTLAAYAHQELPFEKLVDELHLDRHLARNPLFQVMFTMDDVPIDLPEPDPALRLTPFPVEDNTAKFDLTIFMRTKDEKLTGTVEYNTDLFDPTTIIRLINHFRTLLEAIVVTPGQPLSELALLAEPERQRLLVEWNDTSADYPVDICVHRLFERKAAHTPQAIAVVDPFTESGVSRQLTYQALNRQANQLAYHMQQLGVGPDVPVAICLERSLEMVISVLAILKAGGTYVPLDPAYPRERLAFMLADTKAPVLLTQRQLLDRLPHSQAQMISLDDFWQTLPQTNLENPTSSVTPDHLAYIIYTSGSTGNPKGVAMGHRPLCNLIGWQLQNTTLGAGAKTLQFASLSFDVSFQEIFLTWCAGGTLVLVSEEQRRDPVVLAQLLADEAIERLFLPFIALQQLAEVMAERRLELASLREIITAGEQLQITPALTKTMSRLSGCTLYNQYGPSESHVVTAFKLTEEPDQWPALPPIGRPIANTKIYLLDTYLQPVPVGVPGELYIGGCSLARDYLERPGLTAEKFIPDPFDREPGSRLYKTGDLARYKSDGNIEFLGRIDHQVKIRGFRVELGEIEALLAQHPTVQECAVVAQEDRMDSKRLVAYIVPAAQELASSDNLRRFLQQKLPDYMLPSVYNFLEKMPLTPSGKIDRQALPIPNSIRAETTQPVVAARSYVETKLVHLWEDLLEIQPVGVTDNFFEMGGHSLLAVRMFAEIKEQFGTNLPLATLFQGATIEYVARAIEQQAGLTVWPSLVEIQPQGSRPPFFCVHGGTGDVLWFRELAHHLGPDQPFYGLQSRGLDGIQEPLRRVEDMAAAYIDEVRSVQPEGPYFLGGYCFGGLVVFEMARQLQAQKQQVAFLGVLSTLAPHTGYRTDLLSPSFMIDFLANLPQWLINLWELGPRSMLIRTRRKLRVAKKLIHRTKGEREAADIIDDTSQLSVHRRHLIELNDQAAVKYTPQPYAGHLFDFQPRIPPLFYVPQRGTSWHKYVTGGVTIKMIPGSHQSIFKEPRVRILANQLRTCLDSIQNDTRITDTWPVQFQIDQRRSVIS